MKVTAQGNRPTRKLRFKHKIIEHFTSPHTITTTVTHFSTVTVIIILLYCSGKAWKTQTLVKKEFLGTTKNNRRYKNKDAGGN